ncbi:hypothetical protein TKK_0001760 [Trichogramma kaykai]
MTKRQSLPGWRFISRWWLRKQPILSHDRIIDYVFEHEVTLSHPQSSLELTARYSHSLCFVDFTNRPARPVSVSIRFRKLQQRRQHHRIKRLDTVAFQADIPHPCRWDRELSPQSLQENNCNGGAYSCNSSPHSSSLVPIANQAVSENARDLTQAAAQQQNNLSVPSPPQFDDKSLLNQACRPEHNVKINNNSDNNSHDDFLPYEGNSEQVRTWLRQNNFEAHEATFACCTASDLYRMRRDDLIRISNIVDGIRIYNALHSPAKTLHFAYEHINVYHTIMLSKINVANFTKKLLDIFDLPRNMLDKLMYKHCDDEILIQDVNIASMKDDSKFFVEIRHEPEGRYKIVLKPSNSGSKIEA